MSMYTNTQDIYDEYQRKYGLDVNDRYNYNYQQSLPNNSQQQFQQIPQTQQPLQQYQNNTMPVNNNQNISNQSIPMRAAQTVEDILKNELWFKQLEQMFYSSDRGKQLMQEQLNMMEYQTLSFHDFVQSYTGFPSLKIQEYNRQEQIRSRQNNNVPMNNKYRNYQEDDEYEDDTMKQIPIQREPLQKPIKQIKPKGVTQDGAND